MEDLQTIVFLVRHGQTDHFYSVDELIDKQRQLTSRGRAQAKVVGKYLAQFMPEIIYSSPLERCRETAALIAREIGDPKIETTAKLAEIYSPEPRKAAGERGESIFSRILTKHAGEQVVCVTHQYIIRYAVADFQHTEYEHIPCDSADVYRFVFAGKVLVEVTHLRPADEIHS